MSLPANAARIDKFLAPSGYVPPSNELPAAKGPLGMPNIVTQPVILYLDLFVNSSWNADICRLPKNDYFTLMPNEILSEIVVLLDFREFIALSQVSRRLRSFVEAMPPGIPNSIRELFHLWKIVGSVPIQYPRPVINSWVIRKPPDSPQSLVVIFQDELANLRDAPSVRMCNTCTVRSSRSAFSAFFEFINAWVCGRYGIWAGVDVQIRGTRAFKSKRRRCNYCRLRNMEIWAFESSTKAWLFKGRLSYGTVTMPDGAKLPLMSSLRRIMESR